MDGIRWFTNDTVADALAIAKARQMPLLIDFWDPTCLGCAKLFATTYKDTSLQQKIVECFVALKYDTTRPNERYRELIGRVAHSWHPHILVADERLVEGRRFSGYLSAGLFAAQLDLGLGVLHLYHRRFAAAVSAFQRAADPALPGSVAAEALYWKGIAAYRVAGSIDALRTVWQELRGTYPDSDWSIRADCLDVAIPDEGFNLADPDSIRLLGHTAITAGA